MASPMGATPPPYKDSYLDDVTPPKGFFDRFRAGFGFPTLYPSVKTAVTADVLEVGWIYAAVIVAFSLLLIIPGVRRWNRRVYTVIRIVIAVSFWVFIMLCNFGQDWEVGCVSKVRTQYKAGITEEINATVSVNIGLRSVNISLKGEPVVQTFGNGLQNETIDYNERFSWDNRGWLLGRAFFGPFAGRYNQEFRKGQRYGLPYPILWIAEYLTFDGEGLRWGRFYLQAGYFTHIMLWSAMPLWLLAVILFNMVPRYGGYFSMMTGASLLIGNIIFANLRNANQLRFPMVYEGCMKNVSQQDPASKQQIFVSDNSACFMDFHFAWCFWLCLATGIVCFVIGVATVVMDLFFQERLFEFLNCDITQDFEEFVDDAAGEEDDGDRKNVARHRRTVLSTRRPHAAHRPAVGTSSSTDNGTDIEMHANGPTGGYEVPTFQAYRKRTFLKQAQKSRKTQQRPDSQYPPEYQHGSGLYVDAGVAQSNARLMDGGKDDGASTSDVYVNA